MISLASSRQNPADGFPARFRRFEFRWPRADALILGHECRGSLYVSSCQWHLQGVTELRTLRRTAGLTQHEFAALLEAPVNSFRMWGSGLRPAPVPMLARAKVYVLREAQETEPLPLARLADELGIHVQTLQRAVRTGRLEASFSTRSGLDNLFVLRRLRRLRVSWPCTTIGA
jgi:hypothetical protein